MSVTAQIKRMEEIERRLRNLQGDIIREGANLCADIAQRVINEGKDKDGNAFSAYSRRGVPAYWYFGRSLNASGESRVRAAAKRKEYVSYADFRTFNNRPIDKKNFSFSNEMWRNFGVLGVQYSGGVYVLQIGGKTRESADKIGWMAGQEGQSIIAPSKQELNRAVLALIKKITA